LIAEAVTCFYSAFIDDRGVTVGNVMLWMFLQEFKLTSEFRRHPHVIRVAKGQIFTAGNPYRVVASRGNTLVPQMMYQPNTRIPSNVSTNDFSRVISRTVIDYNQFKIVNALSQDRFDSLTHKQSVIKAGDYNAE
jgi:hypothetical protein